MKTRSSLGFGALLTAAGALLGLSGCGTEFDTIDQLDGLRVMGIQKDKPYARPGEQVELDILYHDTGIRDDDQAEGEPREISIAWLSGCTNPLGDLYQGCIGIFQDALAGPLMDEPMAELPPGGAMSGGLSFGSGPHFSFRTPQTAISGRPPPSDPDQERYGLNYVFFAACAGQLRIAVQDGAFPIACFDDDGNELGARDFVAGYTAIYSYEDFSNTNPKILGLDIEEIKVPSERLCIGADCGELPPDPERKCNPEDPVVKRCEDPDALDNKCETLKLHLSVDPKSVDVDESLSVRQNSDVEEQMWANFHTDRGKFTYDVALVNDLNVGFNKNPDTEYIAPDVAGPAQIWAVVRDSRAGVQWVRTQVCVKD